MANILIAGCGDIGSRLSKLLAERGHRITALRRNPPTANDDSVVFYRADLTRREDMRQLDDDFDQVFFMPAPDRREVEAYRAVYQTGLSLLLERFAGRNRQPQWFLISSTSVYGQSQGEWVDERSPTEPNTETGSIILQAERTLLANASNAVIVRFSGIYGPGRDYLLKKAAQTPSIQYRPPYFSNRIHQDDCASVLAFLSARHLTGRALDSCYLASDDDPAPLWQVVSWLAEQLQYPAPVSETRKNSSNQNKRCRNERLKALGYRFIHPDYRDGYLSMVAEKQS